ncbi:hypothetical protein [Aquimarina algiphila]|uniref:hypothetical protein n=1 Tax=Aquimarina algiphila TaxID=2047982 RepID=UPI00232B3542|nr:hypothetical protein [Aquimarina algiphila]
MKTLQTLFTLTFMICASVNYAQEDENKTKNSSEEIVTKIIRIKGPNGEEKVIKKQEVIKKKSQIKLNPGDENKTNQSAQYTEDEVIVQKSHSSSDMEKYNKVSDDKGFVITFLKKEGNQVSKVRPIGSGYYLVNMGEKDNCVGHFDKDKNFILEAYDTKTDEIITTVYQAN